MTKTRIGHGIDVHALQAGRELIIGGVKIPYETGLQGHSDADVLLHALCDALLGAVGIADIGQQFPPDDDRFRGADSKVLTQQVVQLARHAGMVSIENVDCIIMAEKPRMNPHVPEMKIVIARILGVSSDQVGIKATTTEGLGFVGRSEGIAASVVCLVKVHE